LILEILDQEGLLFKEILDREGEGLPSRDQVKEKRE
jgi:hypothetical protein